MRKLPLVLICVLFTSCQYLPTFLTECPFCTKVCVDVVEAVAEDVEEELEGPKPEAKPLVPQSKPIWPSKVI